MNENKLRILAVLAENTSYTQRELVAKTGLALGTVNKTISVLVSENYLANADKKPLITAEGKAFLAKHKVRNAVILAAGFGSRLLPVTFSTPKPLITVNGVVLIETVIESLLKTEIENIYIVVGYRKEQFQYLAQKYPNIHFITNREYVYKNNISSVHSALGIFAQGNCCVCEADLLIRDPSIFHKYIYSSFYCSKYHAGKTNEWSFKLKSAYINNISVGGKDVNTLLGISYWTPDAAKIVAAKIKELFPEKTSNNLFWDDAVNMCLKDIKVGIDRVTDEQVVEIDTILELVELDKSYEKYLLVD